MNLKVPLSIIVPVYNVEKYLARCVDSILNQSFNDLELILVDDGSTDNSGRICDSYAETDKRISVIHQKNKGLSGARNAGINVARGEYLSFIDSDDLLIEDTYASNMQILLNDKSIDMLQFPYVYPYGSKNEEKKLCYNGYFNGGEEQLLSMYLSSKMNHAVWNKIYHKKIFDGLRFPEGMVFEDSFLISDLVKRIKCIYCSDIGAYGYCLNEGTIMTSSNNYKKYHDRIIAYYRFMVSVSNFSSLKKYIFQLYVNLLLYYLGLLQCQDKVSFDTRLSESIHGLEKRHFLWRDILKSNYSLKIKCMLSLVKVLGLPYFVNLFMFKKKCI